MNQVNLVGRLTKELTLEKVGANQISKVEFTLAVNRDFKNKEGKFDADFIRCTVWNKTAEFLHQYATKGTMLAITGAIRTDSYKDQNGQTVFTTKVFVEKANILSGGKGKADAGANAPVAEPTVAASEDEAYAAEAQVADVDISSSDLPF